VLRIFGRVWRELLHLRFRAFQRHRHDRVAVEWIGNRPILVLPQVMNPVLFVTGKFLAGVLSPQLAPPDATVLDMGAGSGICAIFAAQWARRVVAVDLNPAAVRCATINVLLHRLEERVEVREGDLFAPVRGERFDLILFNPPFLPGQPQSEFERSLRSTGVIERFAAGLRDHLTENGVALVLLSSLANQAEQLQRFRAHGFVADVVARRNLMAEVLTIYRLAPSGAPSRVPSGRGVNEKPC
jgi:release factor glutamine methyltransferase